MNVAQALQRIAAKFPTLAPELLAMNACLEGQSHGMNALPARVLAAGLEALVFAVGPYSRRLLLLDACIEVQQLDGRPSRDDFATAVGLWGVVLARAVQVYRAQVGAARITDAAAGDDAARASQIVATLCADLASITHEAERLRQVGGDRAREELRLQVAREAARAAKSRAAAAATPPRAATPPKRLTARQRVLRLQGIEETADA
jgi:hypothetical protein